MKEILAVVIALMASSVAIAQAVSVEEAQRRLQEKSTRATTQATENQVDFDTQKKQISTMREEMEKIKKQNLELKAELARYEKAKASIVPTIPILLGMTRVEADAAFTLNRWQRKVDSSETKIDNVETWKNPYGKDYRSDYHGAQVDVKHLDVSPHDDDPKPGQPYMVVLKGGIVTRIDKSR